MNSGTRKQLRTEFKRIMRVYEEFLSEKNTRVTLAAYTWRKKVASNGISVGDVVARDLDGRFCKLVVQPIGS